MLLNKINVIPYLYIMSTQKLITVFGSTGNQGGSVVRAILSHPKLSQEWKVRGITRNPSGGSAQKLIAQGVEMVAVSLTFPFHSCLPVDGSAGKEREPWSYGSSGMVLMYYYRQTSTRKRVFWRLSKDLTQCLA
jgi:hypothetical protein